MQTENGEAKTKGIALGIAAASDIMILCFLHF
jgi:hypothetical protein